MRKIAQLGRAVGILATAEAREHAMHADVTAWGAPSECHGLVARGSAKRARLARRHAEAVTGAPLRVIIRQARLRGSVVVNSGQPRWNDLVDRAAVRFYPHN